MFLVQTDGFGCLQFLHAVFNNFKLHLMAFTSLDLDVKSCGEFVLVCFQL